MEIHVVCHILREQLLGNDIDHNSNSKAEHVEI